MAHTIYQPNFKTVAKFFQSIYFAKLYSVVTELAEIRERITTHSQYGDKETFTH